MYESVVVGSNKQYAAAPECGTVIGMFRTWKPERNLVMTLG